MKPRKVKAPPAPRCAFPVVADKDGSRACPRPATTTRMFYERKLPACDLCAANVDASFAANDPAVSPLNWSDPLAVWRWLAGLRLSIDDADAVTRDMLRAPRDRELGPVSHAENYRDAREQILQALAFAGYDPEKRGPAPDDDRPPWETGGET